mmetsp:Transcript_135538/g.191785  ORF Transcript_135538/g.191785 Transcript_135538/m.191785 type:complete len:206 (+) Transcript_135538:68-685(+)
MGPEKARAPSKSTVASSTLESDETLVFPMSMQRTHNPQDLLSQTTVMLRNLPECFTRARLLYLLCKEGFSGYFDFLYVPLCFRERKTLCYAFINFIDVTAMEQFRYRFHGFRNWGIPGCTLVAEVCSCERHQGLSSIIQYYRNNSVMHPSVPDECKPILLNGTQRVPFPMPLKKIKMPKKLKAGDSESEMEKLGSSGAPVVMLIW